MHITTVSIEDLKIGDKILVAGEVEIHMSKATLPIVTVTGKPKPHGTTKGYLRFYVENADEECEIFYGWENGHNVLRITEDE